mgnify:CR=1 FL=1
MTPQAPSLANVESQARAVRRLRSVARQGGPSRSRSPGMDESGISGSRTVVSSRTAGSEERRRGHPVTGRAG